MQLTDRLTDSILLDVYPTDPTEASRARCERVAAAFCERFGDAKNAILVSAPGRTEIGGNHTDHNHGRVLAGSVSMDMLACAAPLADNRVEVISEGFPAISISLDSLEPAAEETGTSLSLIRGLAAAFRQRGFAIGGFCAYIQSSVLPGSGVSSSAAYEVLVGNILNHLYNNGRATAIEIAQMSQYAENRYFGKPCGLLDQMACSVGGCVAMDFCDTEHPKVTPIAFDLAKAGYALCITDTRADHAELTDEYAAIPREMKQAAAQLGASVLRETTLQALMQNAKAIRETCGDRAFLRAAHFFREDLRAAEEATALQHNDMNAFLELVRESGRSSYEYLQNVFVPSNATAQPVSVALCMSDLLLQGRGASRVHGGGFAGTIQAFVPADMVEAYRNGMDAVFGDGSCHVLSIRKYGGVKLV